jgi:hypothetical protein
LRIVLGRLRKWSIANIHNGMDLFANDRYRLRRITLFLNGTAGIVILAGGEFARHVHYHGRNNAQITARIRWDPKGSSLGCGFGRRWYNGT